MLTNYGKYDADMSTNYYTNDALMYSNNLDLMLILHTLII